MSLTATRRRGESLAKSGPTMLIETNPPPHENNDDNGGSNDKKLTPVAATASSSRTPLDKLQPGTPIKTATVRRKLFGTGPFDRYWLNVDCCGLSCALFTYALHLYAVYTVCFILLPPWMSELELENMTEQAAAANYPTEVDSSSTTGSASAISSGGGSRHLSTAGYINQFAFVGIAVMAIVAHFNAMTTDPGAVPPDAKPLPEPGNSGTSNNDLSDPNGNEPNRDDQQDGPLTDVSLVSPTCTTSPQQNQLTYPKVRRLCRRCKSYKPNRAHHCSLCKRCIIKMDHHCPWVNNCVGIGNHKYFLLFVLYTFVSCAYSIVLVVVRFSTCVPSSPRHGHRHRHVSCLERPSHLIQVLGLMVEAVMFGMFTSCMMMDQYDVIFSKITHIDRLKGGGSSMFSGESLPGVLEVFGTGYKNGVVNNTRFRLDWLSPLAKVCFPPSLRDEVMGFCRPCRPHHASSGTPGGETEMEPFISATATPATVNGTTSVSEAV